MKNKIEKSDYILIKNEKEYIEEDRALIKHLENILSILKKSFEINEHNDRLKKVIDNVTDLIQYEKEKLEGRISAFPKFLCYISVKSKSPCSRCHVLDQSVNCENNNCFL